MTSADVSLPLSSLVRRAIPLTFLALLQAVPAGERIPNNRHPPSSQAFVERLALLDRDQVAE